MFPFLLQWPFRGFGPKWSKMDIQTCKYLAFIPHAYLMAGWLAALHTNNGMLVFVPRIVSPSRWMDCTLISYIVTQQETQET